METDLLDTNKVVASGDVARNRRRQLTQVEVRERERVERRAPLGDLEPVGARAVPCGCCFARRHLSEVDRSGALMVERVVQDEANGRSGSN